MELPGNDTCVAADGGKSGVNFFVLGEDQAATARARILLHGLTWRLGPETKIFESFWRLSLLRPPALQERAALEAARARVIIVALDKRSGVPRTVQEWTRRWLYHKAGHHYLIGLVQEELEETDPPDVLAAYLNRVAAKAGGTFFCWNELTGCDFESIVFRLMGCHHHGEPAHIGGGVRP